MAAPDAKPGETPEPEDHNALLAVVVGLLAAYWALRVMLPAVLRVLRPFLFLAIVLAAVWVLYPAETCSIELLSRLPVLCAH